jgi:hypothetical protein
MEASLTEGERGEQRVGLVGLESYEDAAIYPNYQYSHVFLKLVTSNVRF